MKRFIHLIAFVTMLVAVAVPGIRAQAASTSPVSAASSIRESLFDAQMALSGDIALSRKHLAGARAAYTGEIAERIKTAAPDLDSRILSGLKSADKALAEEDAPAFAAARAQIWTAILAGGYAVTEDALRTGDGEVAQRWLLVREFRTTTRFSRPNSDATRAVDGFVKGTVTQADVLLSLRADLLDTYQARLTETLHDLEIADSNGFQTRRAELAALAEGYFIILAPAYGEQRGADAAGDASAAFAGLREAALAGENLDAPTTRVDDALLNFRAAPLSPAEQSRRAGQMLRYLSLVSVEYGRGVTDNQVTADFEIQEAITFHAGAYAAFADLQDLLDARDHDTTSRAEALFETLDARLSSASQRIEVADVDTIQAEVDTLTGLLKDTMPTEWTASNNAQGDFDVIASMLDQMEASVGSGDYDAAEASRLEAYAIMETGPEARIMLFAPELKLQLEELFWNGQGQNQGLAHLIKNRAALKEVKATRAHLDSALEEAQVTLGANTAPAATATNAGMIMFREGLEAIIILASLMGSMKRPNERKYRKPMWIGSGLALLATCLTWLLAHDVLQSLARYGEKLEAVVSLIAVAVLLLIMNWFFHKLYWTEWIASFHARKRQIISGEAGLWLGLIVLGFTSVYREGFETVLFLQALVLESGVPVVLIGVAAGLLAVALIGVITFRLQVNLPYKKMLILTGILVGGVLLQMVGNTTHVMQVVGWLPISVIEGVRLPFWLGTWFGVYATWQGVLAQAVAAVFVIGTYYIAEAQQKRQRDQKAGAIDFEPISQHNVADRRQPVSEGGQPSSGF